MTINVQQVKELREKTGTGMMDCKNALTASEGDLEKRSSYFAKRALQRRKRKPLAWLLRE